MFASRGAYEDSGDAHRSRSGQDGRVLCSLSTVGREFILSKCRVKQMNNPPATIFKETLRQGGVILCFNFFLLSSLSLGVSETWLLWLTVIRVLGLCLKGTFCLPVVLSGKESACQCRRCKRCGFDPWVGKIPWRSSVFLPGESHGQRSLVDYGP